MPVNKKAYLVKKLFSKTIEQTPTRNGFGLGVLDSAKKNKHVVGLSGDLTESTRMNYFKEKFPERFVEVGVAEQNMTGIAAGMAIAGKVPFISSYAVFSPGRSWDQVRVSVAYNQANVKITGAHAGISVGPDGATHQALEDIAIMRVLPNMVTLAPCDSEYTWKATMEAATYKGPVYLRFARNATPVFTTKKTPFKIGTSLVLWEGKDVAIAACGPLVYQALLAAKSLEAKGISCRVIDVTSIKPLDEKTIAKAAKDCGAFVTVEEHQKHGGMGSAVMECLAWNQPVPVETVAVQDRFGESGEPDQLLKAFGLMSSDIEKAVRKVIKRK